jgi:hypothetical protein
MKWLIGLACLLHGVAHPEYWYFILMGIGLMFSGDDK